MPSGLTGAPSSFQRLMDKTLSGLPFVTIYLDDILIHSDSHVEHLKIVFQRIRDAGLTLRGTKCHIGLPSVRYLGHMFSAKGMSPDPKTSLIGHVPLIQLRFANSWGCIILQALYTNIGAPLYLLTQNNIPFLWDEACNKAFGSFDTSSCSGLPLL